MYIDHEDNDSDYIDEKDNDGDGDDDDIYDMIFMIMC